MARQMEKSERREGAVSWQSAAMYFLRAFAIFAVSLTIVAVVVYNGFQYAMNKFWRPVESGNGSSIVFEVPKGANTSEIAKALHDSGLIRSKAVFKVYVDFTGKGEKLRSGTYTLNRSMEIEDIVDLLVLGDGQKQEVIKFRTVEGMNVEEMAQALVDQGVLKGKDRFLELAKTGREFKSFDLIGQISNASGSRRYVLEGYLFPDTYEVFAGSSEETVINRMLVRFFDIFTDEDMERAQELNMTMDQIVTLASLIEKEARPDDFYRVSAVFHNRLAKDMPLQSDVTVQYVKGIKRLVLTSEDTAIDSPYNTYKYKGLPVGPVCNPSRAALQAALHPDEAMMKEGYYYFCLKDPKGGELAFSKTLKAHNAEVEKYRALWKAYDEEER